MWESNAVMRYLVVNHDKEHVLYPEDAKLRGRIGKNIVLLWLNLLHILILMFCVLSSVSCRLMQQTWSWTGVKLLSTHAYPPLVTLSSAWLKKMRRL